MARGEVGSHMHTRLMKPQGTNGGAGSGRQQGGRGRGSVPTAVEHHSGSWIRDRQAAQAASGAPESGCWHLHAPGGCS